MVAIQGIPKWQVSEEWHMMICPDDIPWYSPKSPFLLFKWEKHGAFRKHGQLQSIQRIFSMGKPTVSGYRNFKKPPNGKTWGSPKKVEAFSFWWVFLAKSLDFHFFWSNFMDLVESQQKRLPPSPGGARTCAEPLQNGSIRCRRLEAEITTPSEIPEEL